MTNAMSIRLMAVCTMGGIAPTVGACHFQTDKWIIEITRLEDGRTKD